MCCTVCIFKLKAKSNVIVSTVGLGLEFELSVVSSSYITIQTWTLNLNSFKQMK